MRWSNVWLSFSFLSVCVFYRRLLGIITKKDILKHMAQIANRDPDSILFNWASSSSSSSVDQRMMKTPARTLKKNKTRMHLFYLVNFSNGRSRRAPFAQATTELWIYFVFFFRLFPFSKTEAFVWPLRNNDSVATLQIHVREEETREKTSWRGTFHICSLFGEAKVKKTSSAISLLCNTWELKVKGGGNR